MTEQNLILIKEKIQQYIQQGFLNEAETVISKYASVIPTDPDIYTLKAMLYQARGYLEKAVEVLTQGLNMFPLRADLHINLGMIFEQMEEYLEAYHLYMRASYLDNGHDLQNLIIENLRRIMPYFKGGTALELQDDNYLVITSLTYGKKSLIVKTDINRGKERIVLLDAIAKNLSNDANTVLEIEFGSGIISRNLNYYGYDVEAIDSRKSALLELISLEWQENLRQPEQKKPRYFHNELTLKDVPYLSNYDVIVVAPNDNKWYENIEEPFQMVEKLVEKVNQQLFVKLPNRKGSNRSHLNFLDESDYKVTCILENRDQSGDYELFMIEKVNSVRERFVIPIGIDANCSRSTIVEVDISKCCDKYGFSYSEEGFHPFVEMIRQYIENPNIEYESSVLKKFYQRFQPNNLAEALFLNDNHSVPLLKKGWIGYPWLWNENLRVLIKDNPGETRPGGFHFFGPNTDEFGLDEMERLTTIYEMLDKIGYLPEMFADGYISGYMLKYKDDYRFVIVEGQHRIAALAALGYKKIKCRFTQIDEFPRIVEYKDIKKWPQVKNGTFSRKVAEQVFLRFFQINGRERAQQCGLLENHIYK